MPHPSESPSHDPLSLQIAQELLRQNRATFGLAHHSFQAYFIMTVVSAIVSLTGVGLLLTNRASEGAIATATGLVSGGSFLTLTKKAEERLEQANARLDKILPALPEDE
jgi:hypothetical protein